MWQRAYVHAIALVYLSLGVAFTLAPVPMFAAIDIQLETPLAITDGRATYGGMELGIAAGLWLALARDAALAARIAGIGLLCLGCVRFIGIVVDDGGTPMMWTFLGLELVLGVLGAGLGPETTDA